MNAILVTGSRFWTDRPAIWKRLMQYPKISQTFLIHGACKGADTIAGQIGREMGFTVHGYPANWNQANRRSAGPKRNRLLLSILRAFIEGGYLANVEAFPMPTSVGTRDMLKLVSLISGVQVTITEGT